MKCQVHKNCPRKPQILLITSCDQQHLTETLTCQTHLAELATLSHEMKLYCHCGKPILTGLYKNHDTIHNLNNNPSPGTPK